MFGTDFAARAPALKDYMPDLDRHIGSEQRLAVAFHLQASDDSVTS